MTTGVEILLFIKSMNIFLCSATPFVLSVLIIKTIVLSFLIKFKFFDLSS